MSFEIARIRHSRFSGPLRPSAPWRTIIAVLFVTLLDPVAAPAVERAEDFVKGLQDRGYHDIALDYLASLKSSPLANEATRKQVPYLRGVAMIEQSRHSTDPAARNRLLDSARQELESFAEANPGNVEGAEAQLQLATLQMTRGQELVAQAEKLPKEKTYDSQRKDLGHEARLRFAEARDTFERAQTTYDKELEKLPPATGLEGRDDSGSKRQEYRSRVAQLRFLAAQTQFEAAQSYPPEADEFRKLNETAAQELSAIYDEFARTLLVGLYARLYEGRCYQAIGNYQLALGCYEELLGKDNLLPQFRKLIAAALFRKAEVLIAQQKYDAAIEACSACLRDAHKDEEKQPEWLAVRFCLAQALTKKSASLPPDTPEARRMTAEAREAFRLVARTPGEFQAAARTAAASGGVTLASASSEARAANNSSKEEPKTFQAAYDLGKEALSNYNAARLAIPSAQKNNPPAVPELQAEMAQGKVEAERYFRLASSLVESDTDPKLLNEVRYFLCWLNWEAGDYYRAAVLGEFLARRFPDHPAAASAAKIAMASFERLYNEALMARKKNDDGTYEAKQMAEMAQFIIRRWPGTDNADAAFAVLVGNAIRKGNTEDAEKLLSQASEQSRPRLELLLGNALWGRYLELSQPVGAAPNADLVAKTKATSVKYLQSGFNAARKESPLTDAAATAVLYLVQAMLSDGNYDEAIKLLEDKEVGPLKLVEKESPAAARPQYAIEAYKAALRAYVSVTPPQEKKALATMQSLEKVVNSSGGADGKAGDQLTRIYISMGAALQKQMEELRDVGKHKEASRVAAAIGKFLDRMGDQQTGGTWPTRAWLAQMYYTMGTEDSAVRSSSDTELSKSNRDYLTKARDTYQKLVEDAAKDPKLAPNENSLLAAKVQLGECQRALGDYEKALDLFAAILTEKEASLSVQRSAALAYQQRGQRDGAKFLEAAIFGGYKNDKTGQNRVWGWLRISQVAARASGTDSKFRDSFFEARLNISKCRYLSAMKQTGDQRKQELVKARQSIDSLARLYPDLGGDRWKPQFDALLKSIDRDEGNPDKAAG